jgi:putative restriction endonuclease
MLRLRSYSNVLALKLTVRCCLMLLLPIGGSITFSQEVGGNYLWSPLTQSNGGRSEFYENMKRVRPGDIVFSFADAKIKAVGVCEAPACLAPKPEEFGTAGSPWKDTGWRLPVKFTRLQTPIRPKDLMGIIGPTLPNRYSPIKISGDGNQGAYLASIPSPMANALIYLIGQQWDIIAPKLVLTAEQIVQATILEEETVVQTINNRTDIGETQKLQLVWARRGQGIYRQNLEQFEVECRVTGVRKLRHLRASHIKPWRACSDFEKIDGNNGLLLSPHVDHLFDKGYISFLDDGTMLVGSGIGDSMLLQWGIDRSRNCGPFRADQLIYLSFHRESVFETYVS